MPRFIPPLIPIGIAFLLGIALAGQGWLPEVWGVAALGALGLAALCALALRKPGAGLALACAAAALLGWSRFTLAQPPGPDPLEALHYHGKVTVRGMVVEPPDVRERYTNLYLEATQIITSPASGLTAIAPTRALVKAQPFVRYAYGDVISVTAELRPPPTGVEFSYRDYLARQGIRTLIEYAPLQRAERGRGNPFFATLYDIRDSAQSVIERSLPEPQASLLSGILLGQDQGIPRDTVTAFQRTSTTHIIAISGYNISLVAGFLATLGALLLRRRRVALMVIGGIMLYALFVGGGASVVRAAIMGALLVLGPALGRQSFAPNTLAAAALAMAVGDPFIVWDIGFQLSAGATLGILLFASPLAEWFARGIGRMAGRGLVGRLLAFIAADSAVTLAAMLAVEPLIVYYFHGLSSVSLIVNLLVLPAQPAVIAFGTLAVLGGWLHPALGQLLGWLAWLPLTWTIAVVEWWAHLPFASFDVGRVPVQIIGAYYAVLGGVVWLFARDKSPRAQARHNGERIARFALGALAAVTLLAWLAVAAQPDARLHVWFLDAGPGDALLARTPSGRFILIDGGAGPQAAMEALGRQMPFYRRDVALLMLTSASDEKAGGLASVVERYSVARAILPDLPRSTAATRQLSAALKQMDVAVTTATDGLTADLGDGVRVIVIRAGKADEGLTVRMEYGAFSLVLDGDGPVAASGDAALIVRLGAHGGKRPDTSRMLRALQPQFAIISTGAGNRTGDPATETLQSIADAGVALYRTDLNGAIEFISDGERVWVSSER